jgi:hypothetical protein
VFRFGRRALDLAVLFLAAYAFACVPLGRRTGLEHVRAIFATRAARDAGREIEAAAWQLGQKLVGAASPADTRIGGAPVVEPRGTPVVPPLPRRANAAFTPAPALGRVDPSVTLSSSVLTEPATELSSIVENRCGFR